MQGWYTHKGMSSIFLALLLVSLVCLAWVFFAPYRAAKAAQDTVPSARKHPGFIFGFLTILFFILVGVTAPQNPKKPEAVLNLAPAKVRTQNDITTKQITQTEPLIFTTITNAVGTMPKGQEKIIQAGKNGTETLTFSVVYTDGQETSKTLLSEVVTVQPISQIVDMGTGAPADIPPHTAL
jgi:hypothetical protein